MKTCEDCGRPFEWGWCDGKWVPLVPVGADAGLPRAYVDKNGQLRADHRDSHTTHERQSGVAVTRLSHKIMPEQLGEHAGDLDPEGDDPFRGSDI